MSNIQFSRDEKELEGPIMYSIFRFKTILFLLLNINLMAFTENTCNPKIAKFEKILNTEYKKELKNYNLNVEKYEPIENSDKCIMVKIYKGINKLNKEDIYFKTLIIIVNIKSGSVENSHLFSSMKNKESTEFSVVIDTKNYKNISSTYAFFVGVNYLEKHGSLYMFHDNNFIYETYNKDIKIMLQKFNTSSFSYYDRKKVQLSRIGETLNKNIKLTPYGTLEFIREYYYEYLPEEGGEHKHWTAILGEPQKYVYKNGQYQVTNKSFSPVFDLKQIEMHTKNGLNYTEIVLRAMLYEYPIDKNNIGIYKQIAYNLKHANHLDEANYLEKEISLLTSK